MSRIASQICSFSEPLSVSKIVDFVERAKQYDESVYFYHKTQAVNGKSISALVAFFLTVRNKDNLLLVVQGEEPEQTLSKLLQLLTPSVLLKLNKKVVV